jgi:hypothetical protein
VLSEQNFELFEILTIYFTTAPNFAQWVAQSVQHFEIAPNFAQQAYEDDSREQK